MNIYVIDGIVPTTFAILPIDIQIMDNNISLLVGEEKEIKYNLSKIEKLLEQSFLIGKSYFKEEQIFIEFNQFDTFFLPYKKECLIKGEGKVVISTAIGAEGINCTDGKDILIANTPQEFVNQLKRCLDDPDFCRTVSNNARQLIKDEYNTPKTTEKLVDFYDRIAK